MAFSVHTFETNPEGNLGFAFHQSVGEGQEVYFLGKFTPGTQNPQDLAETIFGTVVNHLEKSKIADSYDRFEDALKTANLEAKKLANQYSEIPEMVIAYFDFHQLYLSQSGSSEAYLVRDGGVSQITEIPEQSEDLFLNILSGNVAVDDVVLLSSNRILRTLTANELTDIFGRSNFREATNMFRHELSQKSEEDLLITVIGIGKKESTPAAGFLNRVMGSSESEAPTASNTPNTVEKDRPSTTKTKSTKGSESIPKNESNSADNPEDSDVAEAIAPLQEDFAEEAETSDSEPISPGSRRILSQENMNGSKNSFVIVIMNVLRNVKGFRPQKNLVILAGVVLLLFLIGIGLKSINWESEEEVRLREELTIAREALQQADTFLIQGERESAKEYLAKADSSIQEVFKSKSKLFRSDAQFLLADIKSKQLQVENARQVTPNLVADLGVKKDNLEGLGLLDLSGSSFVFDNKDVLKAVRNIVESPTVISEGGGSIIAAASRPDQKMLVFLTDDPRLIEYREGIVTPMQTQDENWKKGIDIKTYGRYAYVLAPTDNQIWKYERRRSNYSNSVAYNQGADLSQAVAFTIDGSIYTLGADGGIQKIFRGVSQEYDFRDLPSIPFSGPNLKVFTTAELDYIYILDPDNQRVLIFVKGDRFATYKRQILYGIDDVRDFNVDENGQKVSILAKDKIYEFSL